MAIVHIACCQNAVLLHNLLSTHDVELAMQLADRIWLMEPDRLSIDTPHQLAADGSLSRFIERPGIHFDTNDMTIRVARQT